MDDSASHHGYFPRQVLLTLRRSHEGGAISLTGASIAQMAGQFLFVSADSKTGKATVQDRALIRRHCMQGRNQKPNSRRSLQATRAANLGPWRKPLSQARQFAPAPAKGRTGVLDGDSLADPGVHPKRDQQHSPDRLRLDHGFRLESGILQLIHQDSVVNPREFMFNCE